MTGIYFSGTGNSKYCIEYFLSKYSKNQYNIFSIEEINNKNIINNINDDYIIIAYPIYYSNMPRILIEFINNNKIFFNNKKIFIIVTMSMFSGDGAGILARILKKYNADIIGSLHLKMPDNISDIKYLCSKTEKNINIINKTKIKIDKAVELLNLGKAPKDGLTFISFLLGLLLQRLFLGNRIYKYKDKLKINETLCIGCKKCINICPMHNIYINHNNKAKNKNNCTLCYRCINECTSKAITMLGKSVFKQYKINDCL